MKLPKGWLVVGWIVGTVLGPLLAATFTGLSAYLDDKKEWYLVGALAFGTATVPTGLAWLGRFIAEPSVRDDALGRVLTTLVDELLKPGVPPEKTLPAVRATAFVTKEVDGKDVLVPHLRVLSSDPSKVQRNGREFQSTATFNKGETFVGQVWASSTFEVYKKVRAEVDFASECSSDQERTKKWAAQFDPGIVERWSDHVRKVRSIWTFAIPNAEKEGVAAVISVDATQADAFDAPEQNHSSSLLRMHAREATAATVLGTFHAYVNRRKRVRGLFRHRS